MWQASRRCGLVLVGECTCVLEHQVYLEGTTKYHTSMSIRSRSLAAFYTVLALSWKNLWQLVAVPAQATKNMSSTQKSDPAALEVT